MEGASDNGENYGNFNLFDEDSDFLLSTIDFEVIDQMFNSKLTEPTTKQETDQVNNEGNVSKQPVFITIDDEQQKDFLDQMKNKNTVRKTEQTTRQFYRWLQSPPNNESRNIEKITPTELDPLIGAFLLSIRKNDGSEYEPDTLTSYHRGIDRHLREKGYAHSIVIDKEFSTSRSILAAKRKDLKAKGKGNRPNAAEPLSSTDEQLLRDKGCIGTENPEQLLNQMWLNNTILFGLRGGNENNQLRWGDVSLKTDENNNEYLEFNERLTKTRTGEKSGNAQRPFKPKQYAHINPATCPVRAYKEFASHRPASMCKPDSPFYLAINHLRRPGSQQWYKVQPLGENTLRQIMSKMAKKAGLPGKKTNHTARKTTCTKLLHAGIAPTTIQQLTGHKNVQSVNNYAVASNEMQQDMSNILSGAESTEAPVHSMSAICNKTTNQVNSTTATGQILQDSKLMNCTINIFHNRPSSSPPPKKFKRIRLLDSSSDSDM